MSTLARLRVHPVDPRGQSQGVSRGAGDHVDMSVDRVLVGPVGKAYMETVDFQGRSNPFLDFTDQAPDHPLLLNIQIIEVEHVAAWGYHDVAVGQRIRMRHGNRILGDDPSFVGGGGAINAGGQVNTITPTELASMFLRGHLSRFPIPFRAGRAS